MRLRRFRRSQDTFSKRQGAREWGGHASALACSAEDSRIFAFSLSFPFNPILRVLRVRMDMIVGHGSRVWEAFKQLASPMIDTTAYASANCRMTVELLFDSANQM